MLLGQLGPGPLEPLAARAVRLVRDRRAEHPVRDAPAVDGCGDLRLERGHALGLHAREAAEVALAREAPELAQARPAALRGEPDRESRLEARELREPLVDPLQLEGGLEPRVVKVVLLVQLGHETVGPLPQRIQLAGRRRGALHGAVG
jgi:hypothetical protein